MRMSNIATPRRTSLDAERIAALITGRTAGIVLAAAILSVLLISLRPFGLGLALGEAATAGGDPVNQIGFTAIGIVSFAAILMLADRHVLSGLFDLPIIGMIAIIFLSLASGLGPAAGLRVFLFTIFAMLGVAAVLVIPRDGEALATVLATTSLAVLGLSYFGLFAFPDRAIHQAWEQEYIHAGLWRGVFAHKNVAGPVMASIAFAGLMLMRLGRRWTGLVIIVLASYFVLNTGSKTTAGVVPMAAFIVLVPALAGQRWLASFAALATLTAFLVFTVGSVLFEPIGDIVKAASSDPTFTGRTSLWRFAIERISERPWTGWGLENFWRTPAVASFERTWYLDWDVRASVHGHNGYVDLALGLGLPAFVYFFVIMIIRPAIDYARVPLRTGNVIFSDFFMMVLVFATLNACLESFFFRRADPVWLFFFMSVLGIRLCARYAVARGTSTH
jgi:O-antigen ligase